MAETPDQPPAPVYALLVVDDDALDRLGSVIRHLCIGMMDEAVQVTVLWRSGRSAVDEAVGPSRVIEVPMSRWPWRQPSADRLLEMLGGVRPPIVHCMSADLARWVRRWAVAWNSLLVVRLTDRQDVLAFTTTGRGLKMIGLAATTRVEEALTQRRPTMRGRIAMVPLGLPAQSEPACLADPEREPTAILTAPLTRDSRVDLVLKAMHMVSKGGQDVQLFILSAGQAERSLRRQVEQLDLRQRVTFAGQMRDWSTLTSAMRAADYYILPAAPHRFRDTTLTAMATGLAIFAPTDTVEDYLIDGQTASLFKPNHADDLAAKWGRLLEDRSAARELAHGALDYVRAHHQASKMVTTVAQLYRQLSG